MPTSQLPELHSSAFFALDLGSEDVTNLRSVEGGGVKADVINHQTGESGTTWRLLGKPKYDPIKATLGIAGGKSIWLWMKKFIDGTPERRSGSIVAADHDYVPKAERKFTDALISEIQFPKWDGSDKSPANIVVTIDPEKVEYSAPQTKKLDVRDQSEAKQKQIAACNFRMVIDGYEQACARVTKVDGFSLKMKIIENPYGTRLEAAKVPGKLEYPNIVFYLPEVDAAQFKTYLKTSIMEGDHKGGLNGSLTFYGNSTEQRGMFQFSGMHIFSVQAEKNDVSSEEVKLVKVEAAIEGLTFELS